MSLIKALRKRIFIGRRGTLLLLFGIGWIAMSFSVWQTPIPVPGAEELWFAAWPTLLRATLWGVTGLIAIFFAFRRNDALGWLALYIMPSQRAISYLMAYFEYLIPGDGTGLKAGLSAAIIWLVLVAVILVCAGWEEPPQEDSLPNLEDSYRDLTYRDMSDNSSLPRPLGRLNYHEDEEGHRGD